MTKREQEILNMIRNNPQVSQQEVADELDITRSSAGVHIANLVKKGYILGKGYILNEDDYVCVVGATNIDLHGSVDKLNLHDSNIGDITTSKGGVGRNIAENLGLLGHNVKLVTLIGTDLTGKEVVKETAKSGVDISNVIEKEGNTGTYLSIGVDDNMYTAINDMKINDKLEISDIERLSGLLHKANYIVLDTNFSKEVLDYIATKFKNKKLILDPVSTVKAEKVIDTIGNYYAIKPNIMEAEVLTGIKYKNEKDLSLICEVLHDKGVKNIFITLGPEGTYYSSLNGNGYVQGKKVEVKNVTGAGDAYVAGIVTGFELGYSIRSIAKIAQNAASIAIQSEETINKEMRRNVILEGINE